MVQLGHKVAQEQVDGVLLLCISVGVAVEAADGGEQVLVLGGRLPVPPLPLEEGGVGFRAAILQPGRSHQPPCSSHGPC